MLLTAVVLVPVLGQVKLAAGFAMSDDWWLAEHSDLLWFLDI